MFDLSQACQSAGVPIADRFTVSEAARVLRVPAAVVRSWVKSGRLACIAYSQRLRFVPAEALVSFANQAHRPAR
jgi:excisionase family DNA binding protein